MRHIGIELQKYTVEYNPTKNDVYILEDGILEGFTFIVSGTDFMRNYFKEIIINLLIIH